MTASPLQALPIERLRERTSTKWRAYPADVLPLFVAETDFPLAPAITARLRAAVEIGDTGYTPPKPGIAEAYAGFARRRYGWEIDPAHVRSTGDVVMGLVEILRATISLGDRVVITPPVYPPFYDLIPEAGGVVETVPLLADAGYTLDLAGIEAALAGGARAVLLCNPHNPTGTVHSRETLAELAEIAARHGAIVVSDEIHAPLVHAPATFTPFLSASPVAASVGYAVASASKAFNLAGLKCALMSTAADHTRRVVQGLPKEVEWRTGHFGALAGVAAFSPESDEWLDALLAALDANRHLLADLLAEHVPAARYAIPDAGYLAWVDLSGLGWGEDPAERILTEARVAVHHGPTFGDEGRGFVRVNFGCSPEVLREAIERIGELSR
ncbi:MAG: aspartate aminotransferase [Actinobacteria bacterium]|uniref:MalY/PatB family protein n=1 Tax=unclassified Microbacterium TaxID=2609290 RepID=UPI000C4B1DA5|nr:MULTISPECIES: aminotransferase class I/II-fold pyridoxal phosphate-dependent enzyme [unclassified Microbacterium]MEC8763495.1 aminotransferase class I/II-fold pyridoxal phosphate-dependent enzyme [Actinomycetota bacterium]HIE92637.1 aminotransferase class I/II-fold pyridoxal phosphate-dependent enzyme [Acidobacteriota bacterium]MBU20658.1 aspartate aminotransferase [Microbacterium sp.]MEE2816033.1 aminotransferase class I/II-fold pyridoxal phosphate-dependent enzyme [Actinomycetota bacterium|tara:strand:+ start:115 stop:1269 length:1155 start_codon:yes stop_codon:yes gene_type:complete